MRTAALMVCAATLGAAATLAMFLLARENPRAIHISVLETLVRPGLLLAAAGLRAIPSPSSANLWPYLAAAVNGILWAGILLIVVRGLTVMAARSHVRPRDHAA